MTAVVNSSYMIKSSFATNALNSIYKFILLLWLHMWNANYNISVKTLNLVQELLFFSLPDLGEVPIKLSPSHERNEERVGVGLSE